MARKRNRPSTPPQGDTGPQTLLQRAGSTVIEDTYPNGVKFVRKRRNDPFGAMVRDKILTSRQAEAGERLDEAWNNCGRGPGPAWTRVRVDCSSRPGDADTIRLDAAAGYTALRNCIPRDCRQTVERVCCEGISLWDLSKHNKRIMGTRKIELRRGLDLIVRELHL